MTNTTDQPTVPTVVQTAECDPIVLLNQIGRGNLAAISGGRWGRILQGDKVIGVDLPVDRTWRVHVTYLADDTYEVTRIKRTTRRTGGIEGYRTRLNHVGWVTGLHAEQVGEAAYRASCFLDPFGDQLAHIAQDGES
jgi:hypothetical protein